MIRSHKTTGIILQRHDVGEADRILAIYTPRLGKLRLKAKGVRRVKSKLAGHIEIFALADFVFVEGIRNSIVTGARLIEHFDQVRSNLKRTSIAYYFCELVSKLTFENFKDTRIFDLLKNFLKNLERLDVKDKKALKLFVSNFELLLLKILGYTPELYHCSNCGERLVPRGNKFSSFSGGVVCEDCATKLAVPISVSAIKVLRLITAREMTFSRMRNIDRRVFKEIEKISRSFVHFILEEKLNSENFLEHLEKMRNFD
ncbi:MAG: recombination protein RecO [uncultured bacterium]|nr:MAG: recombination protein RecO [uncultured bacterium]